MSGNISTVTDWPGCRIMPGIMENVSLPLGAPIGGFIPAILLGSLKFDKVDNGAGEELLVAVIATFNNVVCNASVL